MPSRATRGGMPVVMMHGITDSWRSFESVMAHLPASFHVFALSQRGHGESDRPGSYRQRDFAGDAAAFIEALDLGPALVVGIRWAARTRCGSRSTGPTCSRPGDGGRLCGL